MTIRLGTRASALAMAQADWVAERLGEEVELVRIRTSGDERSAAGDAPPDTSSPGGDKARFVKEIEQALLDEEIDLAVHSAKDVPGELPEGLSIVGVPERADARDALCGAAGLAALAEGAAVGTTSLRRRAGLLALRPDLELRDLRGNVDSRLRRLDAREYDAIVLACAGLERLGLTQRGAPLEELVPAPGQGCLALEARDGDERARSAAVALTDRRALVELTAERALVHSLDATCNTPVGAQAVLAGDTLRLTAFVGLPDGSHWIRDELSASSGDPAGLGRSVAGRLSSAGAGALLAEAERQAARQ